MRPSLCEQFVHVVLQKPGGALPTGQLNFSQDSLLRQHVHGPQTSTQAFGGCLASQNARCAQCGRFRFRCARSFTEKRQKVVAIRNSDRRISPENRFAGIVCSRQHNIFFLLPDDATPGASLPAVPQRHCYCSPTRLRNACCNRSKARLRRRHASSCGCPMLLRASA